MFRRPPVRRPSPLAQPRSQVDVAADFVRRSQGRPPKMNCARPWSANFSLSFANVRIHSGVEAAGVARMLRARAFTYGGDIVLGGDVDPKSARGRMTLAHEFAHAAQQRDAAEGVHEHRVSTASEEGEARAAAARLPIGQPSRPPAAHVGAVLAREDPDEFDALKGFFEEEEPLEHPTPPPEIAADPFRALEWQLKQQKKYDEYQKKLKLLERWKKEKAPGFGVTYNFATAEKEPNMEPFPNAVIFDGSHLLLRRGGKVIVTADAGSGHADVSDERAKGEGPLPDGIYTLSPQKKARAIDKRQPDGVSGAAGIDGGYQVILDKSVQDTWGAQRIRIEGEKLGRVGFFIHGGSGGFTTSGCIKHQSVQFWTELLKFHASIPLVVQKVNRRKPPK